MTDLPSFSEHCQHLGEHLRQVRETSRSLCVTTNGRTDTGVLSPEADDELVHGTTDDVEGEDADKKGSRRAC